MANNKDFKVKNGIQPTVYHEGLGTVTSGIKADLNVISYDTNTFSFVTQDDIIRDIAFRQDNGQVLYVLGLENNSVFQYNLTTGWDLSTASYSSNSFSFAQDTNGHGLGFKTDGSKMYIGGDTNNTIYQYALTTPWDLSTASYESKSFTFTQDIRGFQFKSDGTKLFWCEYTTIYEIDLSTAWDISTASYNSVSFGHSAAVGTDGNQNAIAVSEDGTRMFTVSSNSPDNIYQFSLGTGWDLSTASYDNINFSVTSQEAAPFGLFLKPDNTKLFVSGQDSDAAFRYSVGLNTRTLDLSTGSVFEITPTSDIEINLSNPADSGTVSQATLLLDGVDLGTSYDLANASYDSVSLAVSSLAMGMSFSTDGTSLFIVDRNLDTVVEHTLTTAWDLSTAGSAGSSFSVSGQETNPMEVFFKPDGTKMYVMGTAGDDVNEYNLSTAWNITTASHVQAFSVSAKETYPTGLFFKGDGTKMYVMGSDSDSVHEYDLSTAWDVSTASFVQSKDVSGEETVPFALFFKDDGTKMFIIGVIGDDVNEYNLSTAWDISTASHNQVFSIASQDTSPSGLYFKSDGSKMYVLGDLSNKVYQYTTGTGVIGATITYPSTLEWPSGTAPTSPAIGETDVLTFSTTDGGTSYQAVQAIDGAK